MCQCSIMTAWFFSTLPNRLFETSVHIWKYNLSFLCSSFLLKIFFLFLLFSVFLPFFSYGTISVPPAALPRLSLSPLFCGLLVLLPCCRCIFEQLIRTRKGNMIFLFQPIGGKWWGINLTKICVTKGSRSHLHTEGRSEANFRGQRKLTV